jgi:hypothetical protein
MQLQVSEDETDVSSCMLRRSRGVAYTLRVSWVPFNSHIIRSGLLFYAQDRSVSPQNRILTSIVFNPRVWL